MFEIAVKLRTFKKNYVATSITSLHRNGEPLTSLVQFRPLSPCRIHSKRIPSFFLLPSEVLRPHLQIAKPIVGYFTPPSRLILRDLYCWFQLIEGEKVFLLNPDKHQLNDHCKNTSISIFILLLYEIIINL